MRKLSLIISLGSLLNHIPYSIIPYVGHIYNKACRDLLEFESLEDTEKKVYVFRKVYKMVQYAIENIPFYKELYTKQGFCLSDLNSYEDIGKIPVINKSMLLAVPIEKRSMIGPGTFIANTGGSSGHPLSFYKSKNLKVKEMAYFHYLWGSLGYRKSDLRLHFVGRSHLKGKITYNMIENSLQVDVYTPFDIILKQLASLGCKIQFMHGYPSVLYEFALYCEGHQDEFNASGLAKSLRGVFLKSEFPYPLYREKIESIFGVKSFSHYGHTEVCALAGELHERFRYDVLQSYGYVTVRNMNGEDHLVTTTYDNFASPLIQYDTEDCVSSCIINDGLLDSFQMAGGRSGDFIIDKNGKRLSLTGIIFGNHHRLFDYCSQIQIAQQCAGEATIYYVPKSVLPDGFDARDYFEQTNIDIDFSFRKIDEPFKTMAGKVPLKVLTAQISDNQMIAGGAD